MVEIKGLWLYFTIQIFSLGLWGFPLMPKSKKKVKCHFLLKISIWTYFSRCFIRWNFSSAVFWSWVGRTWRGLNNCLWTTEYSNSLKDTKFSEVRVKKKYLNTFEPCSFLKENREEQLLPSTFFSPACYLIHDGGTRHSEHLTFTEKTKTKILRPPETSDSP